MNRDDIIRLATEVGANCYYEYVEFTFDELERFAALVAAQEREACARVCDLVAREIDDTNGTATYCANAIRARGDQE